MIIFSPATEDPDRPFVIMPPVPITYVSPVKKVYEYVPRNDDVFAGPQRVVQVEIMLSRIHDTHTHATYAIHVQIDPQHHDGRQSICHLNTIPATYLSCDTRREMLINSGFLSPSKRMIQQYIPAIYDLIHPAFERLQKHVLDTLLTDSFFRFHGTGTQR